jgi:hypothetical protein
VNLPPPERDVVRTLPLDAGGVLVRPSFVRVAGAPEAGAPILLNSEAAR